MPLWLHRTNIIVLRSVPEADLPEPAANYIEEPDLTEVTGWPTKYWIVTGDVVTLMDQAARDAVDAAELEVSRDSEASQLDDLEAVLRAFMLIVLDEINILRTDPSTTLPARTAQQLRNSIRNRLGT